LRSAGIDPAPRRAGPTWRQFLSAQTHAILAIDDAACDQLVEQLLLMLGVPFDEARQLAHAPLPDTELPEGP